MSTIEKFFVQLFDQERQIIEELNHQKQLYDKYLLSKLLIQGIPPPPWLLNLDSQSSTSDFTALNKENLSKGPLLSRPEAHASYPAGPCILYENPHIAAANICIPDETDAGKSASSNGTNEDGPGVAPPFHVDGIEDTSGIALSSHVPTARSGSPDETCAVKSASSNGIDAVGVAATPLYHVDRTEDATGIAPPFHVDERVETFSYVPMSPEDQTDTRFSNACQLELSHAMLHRSKSRQKALELRNSANATAKRSLGMENSVGILSGSKTCKGDEQLDGFKESLELTELSASPTKLCSNKEVAVGNSLEREMSGDACGISLAQFTGSNARELKSGNNEMEKNITVNGGRITRSRARSSSQQFISTHSGSETYRLDKLFDGSSCSLKIDEPSRLHTEMCFKEEAGIGILSEKERSIDASEASFTHSITNKEQELDFKNGQMTKEYNKIYESRITRSRSSCEQSSDGDILLESKSNGVCVGRMTSSGSGKNQQKEAAMEGSGQQSVGEAQPLGKDCNEACAVRMTRSRSGKTQQTEVAMGNSSAYCGKATRSKSCVAEESSLRCTFRKDVPVKPKQLDFDDVEEPDVCNVSFHLSGVQASSLTHGKNVSDFNLSELKAEVNMLHDFNFNHDVAGSWPAYKRRKIEYQNLHKSASPTLKEKSFVATNENVPSTSAQAEKENILPASHHSAISHNSVAALSSFAVLDEENDQSVTSLSKIHVLTPQVQCNKYNSSSGRTVVASTCERLKLKPDVSKERRSIIAEPLDSFPEDEVKKISPSAVLFSGMLSDGLVNGHDMVDGNTAVNFTCTEGAVNQIKSPQGVDGSKFSIGYPHLEHMDVTEADKFIPEFEGFIIGENAVDAQASHNELVQNEIPFLSSIMEYTSLPEQKCKASSLSTTPVSPFPTSCKLYLAPGMYSSVPNGLLENNGLRNNLLTNGSALLGKSHSDLFSFPSSQYGWDNKKPFFSPVGKGFEGITSKSGGSDTLGNSNPELTCFPILEDPESGEEDVSDAVNLGAKRSESSAKVVANKGLLFDISEKCENPLAPEVAIERVGLESMSTEVRRNYSITRSGSNKGPLCDVNMQIESTLALAHAIESSSQGSVGNNISIHEIDNKKSSMGQRRSRQTRHGKENKDFSVGANANSSKKHSKPLSSRSSKPKLSGQSCLRSRGQSVLEKEQKRNNIVCGIKSFVPLVQQKQAAAAVPEKKDVKVKALQAAEAAKRAADTRENERKQKKEAMKLERARVEQEKMKELELKKKLKEEQRKKREAENAAKKRQREEEEKKEKERKKRRIEEARLQQKQAQEKLHTWKEGSRCAAEDERAHQEKDSNEKTENQIGKETEGNSRNPTTDSAVVGNDHREDSTGLPALSDNKMSMGSSASGKMGNIDVAESSTPSFDKIDEPFNQINQSYELSPYRDSDDEEEEEDEIPNKKFVPSWASKTHVISALSSLQHFDPDVIFPPGSFCSMEEVLLPRRLLQK